MIDQTYEAGYRDGSNSTRHDVWTVLTEATTVTEALDRLAKIGELDAHEKQKVMALR